MTEAEVYVANYKILVVEDSSIMRQLLVMALRRIPKVTIFEAGDGIEALKVLTNDDVDLVFSDINMPGMDGLKLVNLIRSNPQRRRIPIVMVTTEGADEDRERAMALGADEYITKPVQAPEVIETARRLLGA
jgi:two-component system chemotaxis response regulator CheY